MRCCCGMAWGGERNFLDLKDKIERFYPERGRVAFGQNHILISAFDKKSFCEKFFLGDIKVLSWMKGV